MKILKNEKNTLFSYSPKDHISKTLGFWVKNCDL